MIMMTRVGTVMKKIKITTIIIFIFLHTGLYPWGYPHRAHEMSEQAHSLISQMGVTGVIYMHIQQTMGIGPFVGSYSGIFVYTTHI